MSYRELRNLCEMTRTLRYPRLMSIENFRTPNFQLVAELLEWIVRKFSPESTLNAQNLQNETDRVNFVKQAVMLMLQNSRLKMNPKKLYQADGHAVQELIPALKILYDARFDDNSANTELTPAWTQVKNKLMAKIQEVRITRQLSAQLPETGAALSELLSKQEFIAQQHERAAARAVPLQEAEKTLKLTISAVAQEAEQLTSKLNNVASDEAELDEKIERKKREYEQMQKRYAKLQSFRPQYMDEYERYEEKLKNLYELYVLNFRNLTYLQKIHDDLAKSERFRQEENEKAMRLAVEKMRLEQEKKNDLGLNDDEIDAPLVERRGSVRKVYGNMTGAGMDSDSDSEDAEGEGGVENSGAQPKVLENSDDDIDDDIEDFGDIDENPRGKRRSEEEDKNDLSSGDDF